MPVFLSACSMPATIKVPLGTPDVTPAYQTVQAEFTQVATLPLTSETAAPAAPAQVTPAPSATVVFTEASSAVVLLTGEPPVSIPCDLIVPGMPIDVTVPDGTKIRAGEPFSKTWRLVNAGSCTWTSEYAVVYFSGQPMGAGDAQSFSSTIAPGQTVDITVDMVAPDQPGSYQGNWKLRSADGSLFGLGPNGNSPFWVQIEVVVENTATAAAGPLVAPTLPVYSSGLASLIDKEQLDLDSGEMNQVGEDDLLYQVNSQGSPQIIPLNQARAMIFGKQEPAEVQCRSAVMSSSPLNFINLNDGIYICYRTNRGLPGYVHVVQPAEENIISLEFVTWTVP